MQLEITATPIDQLKTDLLVVMLDKESELANATGSALKPLLDSLARDYEEKKIKREFFSRSDSGGIRHWLVFHTSLDSSYNIWEKVKIFAARAMGYAKDCDLKQIAVLLNGKDGSGFLGKVAEGAILGSYSFDKYKKEKSNFLAEAQLTFIASGSAVEQCQTKLDFYKPLAETINEARDLVNEPGAVVYPEVLAELAKKIAAEGNLTVAIKDEKQLAAEGYNGLISVGKGSIHPPRLIALEYQASPPSKQRLALVGKGVTFDSGGISIKPSEKMLEMKGDMAGAAAVLFAMKAIARLKPAIDVIGIIPTAENFPDANAQRPGDIFVAKNGKSIQVDNTDAEGRLILVDAFALAGEMKATHMVDIATLTGAAVRALGQGYAAIMGNHQELINAVIRCGKNHGESFWQLPLPPEYKEMLKTPYADINNAGGSNGGAITAGLFLQEFIPENTHWAHLDIAGPFLFDKPWKYYKEGATGFGLKTLVSLSLHLGEYLAEQ